MAEVAESSKTAAKCQKAQINQHRKKLSFKKGKKVLVKTEALGAAMQKDGLKLSAIWSEPFEVLKVNNPNNYKIALPKSISVYEDINITNLYC
jgi:hypothetical protein